ncbi:MAG: hypothetical protein D6765_05880, partial [Bacteroidetes bacterium]
MCWTFVLVVFLSSLDFRVAAQPFGRVHLETDKGFFPLLALDDCKLSWALLERRVQLLEAEFEEVLKNAGQTQATGPAPDGWTSSGSRIRLADLKLQLAKSRLTCKK